MKNIYYLSTCVQGEEEDVIKNVEETKLESSAPIDTAKDDVEQLTDKFAKLVDEAYVIKDDKDKEDTAKEISKFESERKFQSKVFLIKANRAIFTRFQLHQTQQHINVENYYAKISGPAAVDLLSNQYLVVELNQIQSETKINLKGNKKQ